MKPISAVITIPLLATLALAGCKRDEAPPPVATPAPTPAPTPTPPPAPVAATASVVDVQVGSELDATGKVSQTDTEFEPKQTIIASVTTGTSDPAATVPGTLAAKWLFEDGQVVNEESKPFNFTGPGTTNFQISKPDGWPVGKYTLEVSLNGTKVQTREFTVK
jgi:hypothetical protein